MSYSNYGSAWSRSVIEDLERAGAFEVGIASDRKQRGSAINVGVMDEDREQGLFVLQVRECRFRPGRFNRVRKNYFLCGRNENGNAFAHAVKLTSTNARVEVAQCRIWEITPSQLPYVIRQGDVAVIPERGLKAEDVELLPPQTFVINSETATHIFEPGRLYHREGMKGDQFYVGESVSITHEKGQHPYVSVRLAPGRLYRVQVGVRHTPWRFALGTAD